MSTESTLTTYFPADDAFQAYAEPRTLPATWRAPRFDQADRGATENVAYAVLAVRGRLDASGGVRDVLRALYVTADLSWTTYRDYACIDAGGYRPPADRWRCTLACTHGFGAGDPIAGAERATLERLLAAQYPDRGDA